MIAILVLINDFTPSVPLTVMQHNSITRSEFSLRYLTILLAESGGQEASPCLHRAGQCLSGKIKLLSAASHLTLVTSLFRLGTLKTD